MTTENKYQKSIDRLNQAIGKEIATTLQYLYFHVHFEDDGYEYFSKMMKQTSITEMFHTDKIADRILFLQGEVEMMPSFEPRKIRDVKEALEFSMTLEQRTARFLQRVGASVCCRGRPDHAQAFPGSRQKRRRNISTCSVPRWRTCSTTASNTSPCNRSPTARKLLKNNRLRRGVVKKMGRMFVFQQFRGTTDRKKCYL